MKKRVRAIIVKDGHIILIHRVKKDKEYWVFPGGGLEDTDKSPEDGLIRECFEELGIAVKIDKFLTERLNNDQIELFYLCSATGDEFNMNNGPESTRDVEQYGIYEIQQVSISELSDKDVYPKEISDMVIKLFM